MPDTPEATDKAKVRATCTDKSCNFSMPVSDDYARAYASNPRLWDMPCDRCGRMGVDVS